MHGGVEIVSRVLLCSGCGAGHKRRGQRYCTTCHAAYMRAWRTNHLLTEEQRRKDAARSYAGVYKRRGRLVPKPCEVCGDQCAEMHHSDYARPLDVRWFCRAHRIAHRAAAPVNA